MSLFRSQNSNSAVYRSLERQLTALSYVEEAAVISAPGGRRSSSYEVLWAFVTLKVKYEEVDEEDLMEEASRLGKLDRLPDRYVVVDSLPRVPGGGGVDREALARQLGNPYTKHPAKDMGLSQRIIASTAKLSIKSAFETKQQDDIHDAPHTYGPGRAGVATKEKSGDGGESLERSIAQFSAVRRVAVVDAPHQYHGADFRLIWAFVVLKRNYEGLITEAELHQYAKNQFQAGELSCLPDRFVILDDLPRAPDGGVDKKQLNLLPKSETPATSPHPPTKAPVRSKSASVAVMEQKLRSLEAIEEVTVVSIDDGGILAYRVLWACISLARGYTEVEEDDLHEMAGSLARGPDRFLILDALPKQRGQVDRRALEEIIRSPYGEGKKPPAAPRADRAVSREVSAVSVKQSTFVFSKTRGLKRL